MRLRQGASASPRSPGRLGVLAVTIAGAATFATAMLATGPRPARPVIRLAAAASGSSRPAPAAFPPRGGRLTSAPAVGALFRTASRRLGSHFCTASVVDSPAGDLVITAAHCVTGVPPGRLAFVPGYRDGRAPYGIWQVSAVFVDQAWAGSRNPDHDVAFLAVQQDGSAVPVQAVTGGERLGTTTRPAEWVRVIGYPRSKQRPLACGGRTRPFGPGQQEFDCAGYTSGTSGGPFLAGFDPGTGGGTVIGVIGGYQRGGDTPAVSYSPRFGPAVLTLYGAAVAGSQGCLSAVAHDPWLTPAEVTCPASMRGGPVTASAAGPVAASRP